MATPRPNDDDDNRRGLEAQNWVANKMAEEGYEVEQKKPVSGQKSPDYVVEGRVFDCYAPSTPNVRNIWDKVKAKVIAGQTERVVVSLRDTSVRASQLRRQFEDWPVPGLKEVLVVDDTGAVSRIFP